jgi:hypothetical protein
MGYKKVCFNCRKAFSLGTDFTIKHSSTCPECGDETSILDQKFKPPGNDDIKKWKVVEFLKNQGFIFQKVYSVIKNGSYSGQVKYPETMVEAKEFVIKYKDQAAK